jgi:multiple antibiotic resistance protein
MLPFEFRLLIEQTLLVYAALFPIINPVGGAPVFLAMTRGVDDARRAALARRVAMNAFLLVLASMLGGSYVIEFFGLSVPVIQIGGGVLVCSVAWDLLRAEDITVPDTKLQPAANLAARAFYPMTLPLTVGPGTIAVAITLGAQAPRGLRPFALLLAAGTLGALLLAATIYFLYGNAERLTRRLGVTGTSVLLRLSAFILLCIGVQIIWNGLSTLLGTVPTIRPR